MEEIKEVKFAPGLTADIMFAELHNQGRDYLRLMSYYSSAMLEVETKFKVLNIEFSNKFDRNPIESIQTRLKKPMSIYEKLNRLHIPVSVEGIEKNLNDIAGVRVICSFVDDIYKLADMLAVQDDVYVVQTKDYIKNPKAEWLQKPAHDCRSADFSFQGKKVYARGGAAAHDCDGFLGELRA